MNSRFSIRYSKARAKRGLPCWAVFERIDECYSRAVSEHHTEKEAMAAMAALEKGNKP